MGLLDASDQLLEQLSAFEPSSVTAVPAFFTLLMQRHELYLEAARAELSASEAAKAAVEREMDKEMEIRWRSDGDQMEMEMEREMDKAALMATRRLLGPRLVHVAMGGAVVPRTTLVFMERCVGIGGPGGGNCIVANGCAAAAVEPTRRGHLHALPTSASRSQLGSPRVSPLVHAAQTARRRLVASHATASCSRSGSRPTASAGSI